MIEGIDWRPLTLSLQLALSATLILLLIGVPIAFLIFKTKRTTRSILEAFLSLPLVLPPTVLGFYLLVIFSPMSGFGGMLDSLGLKIAFTYWGLLVASVIYSLPFMVQPIIAGLENLPSSLSEASYTMGKSKWKTLLKIQLPNIRPSVMTGLVLSFAHTMGEFGVVLMIGGNIPGKTRVASLAVWDEVEKLNYTAAHTYSLVLFVISFVIIFWSSYLNRKSRKFAQL
jgi:molybdate transport system permease protein